MPCGRCMPFCCGCIHFPLPWFLTITNLIESHTMENTEDPRVRRLPPVESPSSGMLPEGEHWQVYEVFRQNRRGDRHVHVGGLHAPNAAMALVLAKEQYGRRKDCFSLWVVSSADILGFGEGEEDMFANNREKTYRDASGFRVSDKVSAFKKKGS